MRRRLPTALLLIAGLLGVAAHAAEEPLLPSTATVTLGGGFAYRNTKLVVDGSQTTQIDGTSPWLFRLRADWFPVRWLGAEAEGLGDFFRAVPEDGTRLNVSTRGAMRLGVAARLATPGGFLLNGSLGYGVSWVPVIRVAGMVTTPGTIFSHGPVARLGVGYSGARFEGVASATLLLPFGGAGYLEPQVWLAGRVADAGPTAIWVGVDVGALLENSAVGYSGASLRVSLAVKVALMPPPLKVKQLEGEGLGTPNATSLKVQVLLPGDAPAAGALVSLDDGAAVAVDERGERTFTPSAGAHPLKVKLAGHRGGEATAQVAEGKETVLVVRLEALTGPGKLSGVVRASATAKPVPDATVTAGEDGPVVTGADGVYRFERVGPGPVQVSVSAQGFTTVEEVAQVPPESAATLDVQLEALGKGSPATVRGLIRSRTGEAIKASVVIKGLATKLQVQVTAEGRFFVTVPGGQYQFVISAPGYVTQTKKVVLADGDQAILHTELQKVSK